MSHVTLKVTSCASALGVVISGVDLSQPLGDSEFGTIRQAFHDHGVNFLRDQRITPEQRPAVARRWAPIDINRLFKPVDGCPEFSCRFARQAGALAFWDNRATWHYALKIATASAG